MKKLIYTVSLFLSIGCAQAEYEPEWDVAQIPVSVEVPETVSSIPELAEYTKSAVERWRAATGRELEYVESGGRYQISFGEPPEGYIGWNYGDGRIVMRETWLESEAMPALILHELGHIYSGSHHGGIGVMTEGIGPGWSYCLTESDVEWACSYYDCSVMQSEC